MKKKKSPGSAGEKKKYQYVRKSFMYEGKQYFVSGKSEDEALKKMGEKEAAVKRGDFGVSSEMTVQNWASTWLLDYVKPKVRKADALKGRRTMSEKNYTMYERMVNTYIVPPLRNVRMKDVRDSHLKRILNSQADKSFSHVSKLRMTIKAMFGQANASRIILYDPSLSLELPAAEKGARRSLSEEEREALLKVASWHKHGLWVRFLLATGLRPNESIALLVGDLDFEKRLVHVNKSVQSGTKITGAPKTDSGTRYVYISSDIYDDLEAHVQNKADTEFVFTQTDGKSMMTETCIKRYWQSFLRQMDFAMGAEHTPHGHIYDPSDLLPDGSPMYPDPKDPTVPRNGHKVAPDLVLYCLRHTFGTDMQKKGVPINIAKYLMGHKDIATTANIYTHSGVEDALAAGAIIDQNKSQKSKT